MLNSFLNMSLSSFSSLFEIAATINIAFVAAEQAKQYGSTLTKNFFQSGINIDRKFSERYARVDKETVDSIQAIVVNGVSTEGKIQEVKRKIHKLGDSKNERTERLKQRTDNKCVLISFSYLSFYMFLYSLSGLLFGGLNESPFVISYWSTFSLLSTLVLLLISFFGERDKTQWPLKKMSLSGCCTLFFAIVLLSGLGYLYRNIIFNYAEYFWPWVVFVSVFIPYISFLVFMMIIRSRLYSLSKEVEDELEEFGEACDAVDVEIHRLKEAYDLSVDMRSQEEVSTPKKSIRTLADKMSKH